MSEIELVFSEPRPSARGPRDGKTNKVLAALRERPGEWAILPLHGNTGGALKQRYGHEGFEFTTRIDTGVRTLYGRYVGNGDAS